MPNIMKGTIITMDKNITAHSLVPDHREKSFNVKLPNKCPSCNIAYGELPVCSYYITSARIFLSDQLTTIYSIFYCPHCEHCFFVQYSTSDDTACHISIDEVYPTPKATTDFSDRIKKVSPKFVEIYSQSEQAENLGFKDICGMGYRKALEFLIKDYAIFKYPDSQSDIESSPLSKCINTFIEEPQIKVLAKASAWIGNDETHYIRKHESYDLSNLKHFISATVAYINYALTYLEASELLQNPQ